MYEVDERWKPRISDDISLRQCTDHDKSFMSDLAASYYPNAVCFKDKSKISLFGNWFEQKYSNIFITIEPC